MVDKKKVESLITEHFRFRPLMKARDLYKLLYQGVFGVSHIIDEGTRLRLEEEAASLNYKKSHEEPLLENISPIGTFVRINLRPYLLRGLSLDRLYSAMIQTAEIKGCSECFLEVWNVLKKLFNSGLLKVAPKELETLENELRLGPFPQHHSQEYRRSYNPAYRVISRKAAMRTLGLSPNDIAFDS